MKYFEIGLVIGFIVGGITFIGSWWYCAAKYGFLLGFGLGWLPAGIAAVIAGVLAALLWGVILALIALVVLWIILDTQRKPDPTPYPANSYSDRHDQEWPGERIY